MDLVAHVYFGMLARQPPRLLIKKQTNRTSNDILDVNSTSVRVLTTKSTDYICITDIAKI